MFFKVLKNKTYIFFINSQCFLQVSLDLESTKFMKLLHFIKKVLVSCLNYKLLRVQSKKELTFFFKSLKTNEKIKS